VSVEVHKIIPIGKDAFGDALCVEVHARGYANWYKTWACFDYDFDDEGLLPDERPTLRDREEHQVEWLYDADVVSVPRRVGEDRQIA